MAKDTVLVVQSREESGTAAVRRLRRTGMVPGIVYGVDSASLPIKLNAHEFKLLLHHHASESMVLSLQIGDGPAKTVLLKDVQHSGLSGDVLHVDFQEVSLTKRMRVHVPISLTGEAAGVRSGGVVDQVLRELDIECLPADLLEELVVDISALEVGNALAVRDLTLPEGWVLHTSPDVGVVTVQMPRVEEVAAAEEAEAAPEVIGEKKAEEAGA